MHILAIETSCDETSIAVLNFDQNGSFDLLSNIVSSQVKIHAPFGGVVPSLAKREHQKNLVPILKKALKESKLLFPERGREAAASKDNNPSTPLREAELRSGNKLKEILNREPELLQLIIPFFEKYQKPDIDYIAVTNGPGLEPALWVGVNFAKALAYAWDLPIIPVNHIEGHIIANWLTSDLSFPRKRESRKDWIPGQARDDRKEKNYFPAISLVVSGGHTQLVLMKKFGDYQILGETRDDAAGEAFDKLAKMLNLGYPGGPIVSKIASAFNSSHPPLNPPSGGRGGAPSLDSREGWGEFKIKFPRPMLNTKDHDFSFSGLKTAALYFIKNLPEEKIKELTPAICAEFQQAVIDVLISKTIKAAKEFEAKQVILAGGVAANDLLRKTLKKETEKNSLQFSAPATEFCGDNAAMIALAASLRTKDAGTFKDISVNSNLRLV